MLPPSAAFIVLPSRGPAHAIKVADSVLCGVTRVVWRRDIEFVIRESSERPDIVAARTRVSRSALALDAAGIGWVDKLGDVEIAIGSILVSRTCSVESPSPRNPQSTPVGRRSHRSTTARHTGDRRRNAPGNPPFNGQLHERTTNIDRSGSPPLRRVSRASVRSTRHRPQHTPPSVRTGVVVSPVVRRMPSRRSPAIVRSSPADTDSKLLCLLARTSDSLVECCSVEASIRLPEAGQQS